MRRLGMKNKHRKSELASDSEPEENVDARAASDDDNDDETQAGKTKNNSAQKSATKRRSSRGTSVQKPATSSNDDVNSDDSTVEPKERENGEKKQSPNKRRKKEDQRASTSARDKLDAENEYEVERLINVRTIKGRRQFLVRWVGYGENDDTWENEKDLNCSQLIEDFLAEEKDKEKEKEIKLSKPAKTEKSKRSSRSSSKKQIQETEGTDEEDSEEEKEISKEFEVERIIEVRFKKNGTKEFLIRWKGFSVSDDTWEPERNLNCPELIAKFMEKLEKAKTSEMRELRANRVHTKRYTLSAQPRGRRLSKRNKDKQRATYHECDE
ncbi:Chromobox protein like protein 5 [Trachymyrmex septentrionalis]|uniref:Chromobox protein like protein 5 n=1 Tax=Trachymyrmex septentrionalis TaxID=34720 RepID=A0A195FDX0_9HYME|nr:PREDICTED: chromobox protein homolog 5-like [Trachymyrmex septentrionalis]XP_018342966.1 PREDICTED: chromobox protein homolog 5-like [Trachymyrmex septentrionalis]XP_018342967.1 PREDICTED: chromobox protein homolog 5-like [Trachymyrmex septentrionalis]XP_018342968.1 PREDICTED: chromobox protein homolog 5-like [Trachymyrmex septentrionalis]KYN38865.1 Chromobox protein like protein 5 [Trachymyrmex septentrionalis]